MSQVFTADPLKAYWVLRNVSGEAFAVADFHFQSVEVDVDLSSGEVIRERRPPAEFNLMIEDRITERVYLEYRYDEISKVEFETYKEFGIPQVGFVPADDRALPFLAAT